MTVPKVIATGESVTIPAGRVAILPNVQIDGVLNVENGGEVFIPSGATLGDLDAQLVLKQNVLVANDAGVKTALNASGTAPIYACRAWVNFNGTGTVAINASGNVSSITDNGTGDYTINFTTAMPDANYGVSTTGYTLIDQGGAYSFAVLVGSSLGDSPTTKTVSSLRVMSRRDASVDIGQANVAIFR